MEKKKTEAFLRIGFGVTLVVRKAALAANQYFSASSDLAPVVI